MRGGDTMKRVILIKYGELSTKKGNLNFFIKTLYHNICHKLEKYPVKISRDRARTYIEFEEKDLEDIKGIIDHIFGIHSYHIANVVETKDEVIQEELLKLIE